MKAGVANRPRILEHVDKLFARLDKNKDGKLSKEEFKNRHHRGHHGEKHENDEK
jgi:Ca2+-binding EF-hand superfamily protein